MACQAPPWHSDYKSIHQLTVKPRWPNTFRWALFMHQSFPRYSQRLHWAYCALYWHRCLLGHFIHLQFSLGNDHEKLWSLAKLWACCQNPQRVNYIVIKCASQIKCLIVLVIYILPLTEGLLILCSKTDSVITNISLIYVTCMQACSGFHLLYWPRSLCGEIRVFIVCDPGSLNETKHINYRKLDPTLWFFQVKRNWKLLFHLEQSLWERFPLSHQPQYGPFEEITAATLVLITPKTSVNVSL